MGENTNLKTFAFQSQRVGERKTVLCSESARCQFKGACRIPEPLFTKPSRPVVRTSLELGPVATWLERPPKGHHWVGRVLGGAVLEFYFFPLII